MRSEGMPVLADKGMKRFIRGFSLRVLFQCFISHVYLQVFIFLVRSVLHIDSKVLGGMQCMDESRKRLHMHYNYSEC